MNKVTFFSAITLAISLAAGSFFFQWMQPEPNWLVAAERSFFQLAAILLAWWIWRDPARRSCRRGEGPGYCD